MSYEISRHQDFDVSIKRLAKRYRSMADDYAGFLKSLQENTFQGAELCPGIRKIRMPITSKGRGKSGSSRVITANAIVAEHEGRIALLTIYDKSDASTVKLNVIKEMAHSLGFEV
ncbi:MAG: addiction module toxin RelE [Prevotella sp.]|nr:addiction module toxin RelE [Prevotella sp.]